MADRPELERMLRSLDLGDIVTVTKLAARPAIWRWQSRGLVASSCCSPSPERTMSQKAGGGYSGKLRYGLIRRRRQPNRISYPCRC